MSTNIFNYFFANVHRKKVILQNIIIHTTMLIRVHVMSNVCNTYNTNKAQWYTNTISFKRAKKDRDVFRYI